MTLKSASCIKTINKRQLRFYVKILTFTLLDMSEKKPKFMQICILLVIRKRLIKTVLNEGQGGRE